MPKPPQNESIHCASTASHAALSAVSAPANRSLSASIIICTRNRSRKLGEALGALTKLCVPETLDCELIVVDNGSTDSTKEVCELATGQLRMPLRYIFEGRQGKSVALNRAILAASGTVLVFTDDDCLPTKNWLIDTVEEFRLDNDLKVLGGRVEDSGYDQEEITHVVGCERRIIKSATELYPNPPIIGANLAARRSVFTEIGCFDTMLGPGSRSGAVAEDIDFVYRAARAQYRVVYSPNTLVLHHHGRQTKEEIRRAFRGYFVGRGAFYMKYFFRDRVVAQMALCDLFDNVFTILRRRIQEGIWVSWNILLVCSLFIGAFTRVFRIR
jgi:glycosyltransferase involved in cell wall biosynthesis